MAVRGRRCAASGRGPYSAKNVSCSGRNCRKSDRSEPFPRHRRPVLARRGVCRGPTGNRRTTPSGGRHRRSKAAGTSPRAAGRQAVGTAKRRAPYHKYAECCVPDAESGPNPLTVDSKTVDSKYGASRRKNEENSNDGLGTHDDPHRRRFRTVGAAIGQAGAGGLLAEWCGPCRMIAPRGRGAGRRVHGPRRRRQVEHRR